MSTETAATTPTGANGPVGDPHFAGLNALRALGAIMVVSTHTGFDTGAGLNGWQGGLLARMDFGVAIFFVLSGFLLSRPFLLRSAQERPHPHVGRYLWKRALRILPLYWLAVGLVWLTFPANSGVVTGREWLLNLTLTQLYTPSPLPLGLTQMWSLATEAAFYLVLPVLMGIVLGAGNQFRERRIMIALAVLIVLGFAWQAWAVTIPGDVGHVAQWLPGFLPWFCAGIALACVSVGDTLTQRRHLFARLAEDPAGCWLVALLCYLIATTPLAGPRSLAPPTSWEVTIRFVIYLITAVLLIVPLVFGPPQAGRIRQLCAGRVPFFLGEISFGIFCLHLIFLRWSMEVLEVNVFGGHFVQVWLLTMACTVAAATAAHYLLERPMSRLRNLGFSPAPKTASDNPSTSPH